MSRALCLLLSVFSFVFTQTLDAQSHPLPASAVEVVYEVAGITLTTYNVAASTLQASDEGSVTVVGSQAPGLVASPNGHFLYYAAFQSNADDNKLYVYDTDASGVPDSSPSQTLSAKELWQVAVSPNNKFAYLVNVGSWNGGDTAPASIVRRAVDDKNGTLTQPSTQGTYQLERGTSYCSLAIIGFNSSGNILYDEIFCSYPHGTAGATYNQRSVDLQTGVLGPDQQIYTWNYYAGSGFESVQFAKDLMFDFGGTEFPPTQWVNVYRARPDVTKPLVNCTSSMWPVCGNYGPFLVHPSAEYVFLFDSSNNTDIGQIDLATRQITQTSSIPYQVGQFSPDGTIAYALNASATDILIYGFNASSGQVTQGGTIGEPSNLLVWLAAQRD